jgi:hypothetical protein
METLIQFIETTIEYKLQIVLGITVFLIYRLLNKFFRWFVITVNERGFSWWNGNEMIPPPEGNRVEVIHSDTTKHHASKMFVEEFTRSLKFVSSIRASNDDGFYAWLLAEVEELRGMGFPLRRLTLDLSRVQFMNSTAVGSFSKIILDVKVKNGIFLKVVVPKEGELMKHHCINLKRLAEGGESVKVKTDGED